MKINNEIGSKRHFEVCFTNWKGEQKLVDVTTEIMESGAFQYGNGKAGAVYTREGEEIQFFDLRYCMADDLHLAMLMSIYGDDIKLFEVDEWVDGLVPMAGWWKSA